MPSSWVSITCHFQLCPELPSANSGIDAYCLSLFPASLGAAVLVNRFAVQKTTRMEGAGLWGSSASWGDPLPAVCSLVVGLGVLAGMRKRTLSCPLPNS